MKKIVELSDVTYTDYNWKLTKVRIGEEIEKYIKDKYDPRKVISVYRDPNRTLIVWERIKVKKKR